MSKIFVIMGKSATGKDTIYKRLAEDKKLKLTTIISYTTRPIRNQEQDGVEYHFVTEEKLEELKEAGLVIEQRSYNTIAGVWHYFTVNDGQFDDLASNYIIVGTLEQYEKIRDFFGKERVIPVYIEVDAAQRLIRSVKREQKQVKPNYAEVCRRFLADEQDFSEENIRRLRIKKRYYNNSLERCIRSIKKDILSMLK